MLKSEKANNIKRSLDLRLYTYLTWGASWIHKQDSLLRDCWHCTRPSIDRYSHYNVMTRTYHFYPGGFSVRAGPILNELKKLASTSIINSPKYIKLNIFYSLSCQHRTAPNINYLVAVIVVSRCSTVVPVQLRMKIVRMTSFL